MKKLSLQYGGKYTVAFELSDPKSFRGYMVMDEHARAVLAAAAADESEGVDSNGDRLPWITLFAQSPWEWIQEGHQRKKLLCRLLNHRTGEAIFSLPEHYDVQVRNV